MDTRGSMNQSISASAADSAWAAGVHSRGLLPWQAACRATESSSRRTHGGDHGHHGHEGLDEVEEGVPHGLVGARGLALEAAGAGHALDAAV